MNILTATDGYHIAMGYLMGDAALEPETHVLYARTGGPLVVAGLGSIVEHYLTQGLSEAQVQEAQAYWTQQGVPFPAQAWRALARLPTLPIGIRALPDGTVVLPGEPIAVISAPALLAAVPEPYLIGATMRAVQVATRFTKAAKAVEWERGRLFEVGLRATSSVAEHEASVQVLASVGLGMSSSGVAAASAAIASGGTMGHRYTQRFSDDESAFEQALDRMLAYRRSTATQDKVKLSFLLDTRDTLAAGLPAAVRVIERRFETIVREVDLSVRLDSGDLEAQLRAVASTFQARFATRGWLPGILIESGLNPERIASLEAVVRASRYPREKVGYGLGGYLVGGISRDWIGLVYKLAEAGGRATMKFANEAGGAKESYPGDITLVERDATGRTERQVALRAEVAGLRRAGWRDLMVTIADDGRMLQTAPTPVDLPERIARAWDHVAGGYIGEEKHASQFPVKPRLSVGVRQSIHRLRAAQSASANVA